MTKTELCRIRLSEKLLPDYELGSYVDGYTNENERFNYLNLLWLLLPVLGWYFLLVYATIFVRQHWRVKNTLVYEGGIVRQWLTHKGKLKKEEIVKFADIKEMWVKEDNEVFIDSSTSVESRHTTFTLYVIYNNNRKVKLWSDTYRNDRKMDDLEYNYLALNSILYAWKKSYRARFNA